MISNRGRNIALETLGLTEELVAGGEPMLLELHPAEVFILAMSAGAVLTEIVKQRPGLNKEMQRVVKHLLDRLHFDVDKVPQNDYPMAASVAAASLLLLERIDAGEV